MKTFVALIFAGLIGILSFFVTRLTTVVSVVAFLVAFLVIRGLLALFTRKKQG